MEVRPEGGALTLYQSLQPFADPIGRSLYFVTPAGRRKMFF